MNILYLGKKDTAVFEHLVSHETSVYHHEEAIDKLPCSLGDFDFLVSYGYRHILTSSTLAAFQSRAINLHVSLLPWNRGCDPNFWSFFDDSPKGVTIHELDEGIDTGNILVQEEMTFASTETLASSYQKLSQAIEQLFIKHWPSMRLSQIKSIAQASEFTYHSKQAIEQWQSLLSDGWDTPVSRIAEAGRVSRNES